ncbi:MAG: S1 RNA-binding domain-containing protein [Ruminococcus sp.]|nr:S1 RNA-binding domain-containing protein [Ruminococcus sp.]
MPYFLPEGELINTEENRLYINNPDMLAEAVCKQKILEAKALLCDREHNLRLSLGGMRAVIPREEGAVGIREGTVRDIAIISRVNRPVCFVVSKITTDESGEPIAVLSREKAQRICLDNYIDTLEAGDIVDARVSRLESFGVFADIGCGIVALMPIDTISVSRIEHPRERFCEGMRIKAVIKSVENGRISLSHKELLGTWKQNAERFSQGETVTGIVRSVESYGAFVELAPNLAGLAESRPDIREGMRVSVFIKSIIEEKMKIKLIIIDAFESENEVTPPDYFIRSGHIDRFLYSPEDCPRVIETVFGD